MKILIKSFSYIFHPLWMPLLGSLIYFHITPKFVPPSFLYAKLMAIVILTVFVPVMFYFLMRNLGMADSIFLKDVNQRRIPLLFQIIFTLIIVKLIINGYEFPELYYFFLGILASASLSLICAILGYKVSLHMVGVCGVLFFVMGLSVHYMGNMLAILALLSFAVGAVATSRLYDHAHTGSELFTGILVGVVPQAVFFLFWL